MLLNIFNNSYKFTYKLSNDLQLWRFIPFTTPRNNHTNHLADSSDHLLWCFSPFLGHGLSAAKIWRQMSSNKVKMTVPQTNPKLEGQGFSLFLVLCSKPVWYAWPYQQLCWRRHSCEIKRMVQIIKVRATVYCYCWRSLFLQLQRTKLYTKPILYANPTITPKFILHLRNECS
jgi:hypothetical protein